MTMCLADVLEQLFMQSCCKILIKNMETLVEMSGVYLDSQGTRFGSTSQPMFVTLSGVTNHCKDPAQNLYTGGSLLKIILCTNLTRDTAATAKSNSIKRSMGQKRHWNVWQVP